MNKEDNKILKDTLEYHRFLNLLVFIKNTISLICFTILAIFFNKWWIVFFATLFVSYIGKDKEKDE